RDCRVVNLEDELRALLATRSGTWGVYARHLDTGETVAIRADVVLPAQSSLKAGVLLAYTKRIRLGLDDADRRVALQAEDHELGGMDAFNTEMDALGLSTLRLHDTVQQGSGFFTATPRHLAELYTHLDDHAREILYRVDKVDFLARRLRIFLPLLITALPRAC